MGGGGGDFCFDGCVIDDPTPADADTDGDGNRQYSARIGIIICSFSRDRVNEFHALEQGTTFDSTFEYFYNRADGCRTIVFFAIVLGLYGQSHFMELSSPVFEAMDVGVMGRLR